MSLPRRLYTYYESRICSFTNERFYTDVADIEEGIVFRGMSLLRVMRAALNSQKKRGDIYTQELLEPESSFSKRRWIAENFANAGRSNDFYGYEEQQMYEDEDWALAHRLVLPMEAGRLIVPGILLSAPDNSEVFTERLGNVVRNTRPLTIGDFSERSQAELRRIFLACIE